MNVAIVRAKVKPEAIDEFRAATIENARESLKEPGIARFDVLQDAARPNEFVLVEVYRTSEAPARHKETDHYLEWRDLVAPMMEEPRQSQKLTSVFPGEHGWDAAARD